MALHVKLRAFYRQLMWHDNKLRRKFSEKGRKTADERDIKKSITKLIEVYKELS